MLLISYASRRRVRLSALLTLLIHATGAAALAQSADTALLASSFATRAWVDADHDATT